MTGKQTNEFLIRIKHTGWWNDVSGPKHNSGLCRKTQSQSVCMNSDAHEGCVFQTNYKTEYGVMTSLPVSPEVLPLTRPARTGRPSSTCRCRTPLFSPLTLRSPNNRTWERRKSVTMTSVTFLFQKRPDDMMIWANLNTAGISRHYLNTKTLHVVLLQSEWEEK